jgi:hypothetical protein
MITSWSATQRVGEPEPLAHAERVLLDALARGAAVEADQGEQRVHPPLVDAHRLRRHGERLASAAAAVLRGGVEQDPDAAAGVRQRAVVAAEHRRFPVVRVEQPAQHPHRGGLAGPVRPEEPGHGAGLAPERHVVHDDVAAEALRQSMRFDHAGSIGAGRPSGHGRRARPAAPPVDAGIDFGRGSPPRAGPTLCGR